MTLRTLYIHCCPSTQSERHNGTAVWAVYLDLFDHTRDILNEGQTGAHYLVYLVGFVSYCCFQLHCCIDLDCKAELLCHVNQRSVVKPVFSSLNFLHPSGITCYSKRFCFNLIPSVLKQHFFFFSLTWYVI